MAKTVDLNSIDALLNDIKNNGNRLVVCSAQPVAYADLTTYKLAEVALVAGDYTLANGSVSGRKVTIAAKAGLAVAANGTALFLGIGDSVNARVKLVTSTTSQALNTGGTVDIPAWVYEDQQPT